MGREETDGGGGGDSICVFIGCLRHCVREREGDREVVLQVGGAWMCSLYGAEG